MYFISFAFKHEKKNHKTAKTQGQVILNFEKMLENIGPNLKDRQSMLEI